ncbi:hypothetical protein OPQ81_000843 [Rhizoctonia solani]|nr:hypothetical protein OPQ81_000843 [Rhizoctonia solani]
MSPGPLMPSLLHPNIFPRMAGARAALGAVLSRAPSLGIYTNNIMRNRVPDLNVVIGPILVDALVPSVMATATTEVISGTHKVNGSLAPPSVSVPAGVPTNLDEGGVNPKRYGGDE